MLKRLKNLLAERPAGPAPDAAAELRLAATALLVEAASLDESVDATEMDTVVALVGQRFGLEPAACERLVEEAHERVGASNQLFGFTQVLAERMTPDERNEMLEMLWQVVYADGALHDYEASLMRRVAGLLHVSDRDSATARRRALARLENDGS
ncbi:MAG: TerB family tellurite resistance protein [Kiloniellales bacterium]